MAKRESLKIYQDVILQKMEEARMNDAGQKQLFFGFSAGAQKFLINGKDVSELTSPSTLEPMPASKPWAAGVANIKGSVHSITDFSVLMGGDPVKRGKFLVLEPHVIGGSALLITGMTGLHDSSQLGLAVDALEMKTMPAWIPSCHEVNGEKYFLVDATLLASDERFSKLQSGDI